MNCERRFYVYFHRIKSGPRAEEIFYVGKGTGSRAYSNTSRNQHWHNINNKYGRRTEIYRSGLTSKEACDLEKELIRSIGREKLTNKSKGGDSGALGVKHSEEWKRSMSDKMKIIFRERMSRSDFIHPAKGKVASEEKRNKISSALKMRWSKINEEEKAKWCMSIKKGLNSKNTLALMRNNNVGTKNPMYDRTIREFTHKSGVVFTGTQYDLIKKFNLNQGNISNICVGRRKTSSGWRVSRVIS